MIFGRMMTAMITPFDDGMNVDFGKAADIAEYLLEQGNDGVVVAGTTGESPTLTAEEKLELFRVVKERVGNRGFVIAGTGSNSTEASVEMSVAAEKTGVDGIMAVAPYYNKPCQEGLFRHFEAIAEAVSLPVMVYNIPGRTGVNILPETMARLAGIRNIKALKEAGGSPDQMSRLRRSLPADFSIYSGDDSLTLPFLSLGGCGVVSVVSHVAGKDMRRMIECFVEGQVGEAEEIHRKIFPLIKAMFVKTNPIPVKAAMKIMGIDKGSLRLPLVELAGEELELLVSEMKKYRGN